MLLPMIVEAYKALPGDVSKGEVLRWVNTDFIVEVSDQEHGGCIVALDGPTGGDALRVKNFTGKDIAAAMMGNYPPSASVESKTFNLGDEPAPVNLVKAVEVPQTDAPIVITKDPVLAARLAARPAWAKFVGDCYINNQATMAEIIPAYETGTALEANGYKVWARLVRVRLVVGTDDIASDKDNPVNWIAAAAKWHERGFITTEQYRSGLARGLDIAKAGGDYSAVVVRLDHFESGYVLNIFGGPVKKDDKGGTDDYYFGGVGGVRVSMDDIRRSLTRTLAHSIERAYVGPASVYPLLPLDDIRVLDAIKFMESMGQPSRVEIAREAGRKVQKLRDVKARILSAMWVTDEDLRELYDVSPSLRGKFERSELGKAHAKRSAVHGGREYQLTGITSKILAHVLWDAAL